MYPIRHSTTYTFDRRDHSTYFTATEAGVTVCLNFVSRTWRGFCSTPVDVGKYQISLVNHHTLCYEADDFTIKVHGVPLRLGTTHRVSPTWRDTYLSRLPPELSAVVLEPSLSCRYLSEYKGIVTTRVVLSTPAICIEWLFDIERESKGPLLFPQVYAHQSTYMDEENVEYFDTNDTQPWLKVPRRVHNKIVELVATL